MKAYYARDGAIASSVPTGNAVRLNRSAARVCLPEIPVEDQLARLRARCGSTGSGSRGRGGLCTSVPR